MPAVVAAADARIFSAQNFAFAAAGEQDAVALLSRTQADGGGHTGYNLALSQGPRLRSWMQFGAQRFVADPDKGSLPFRSQGFRVSGGADTTVGATGRLGVAIGYERQSYKDQNSGGGDTDVLRASVYGSVPVGPIGLSAVGSYAYGWVNTQRATGIGQASVRRHVSQWLGGAQAAVPFTLAGATITPAAGVIVSHVRSDGFAEAGAVPTSFRVTGIESSRTSASPFAQIGWSYTVETASGLQIIPDATIGYRRSDTARGLATTLVAADGTAFTGNAIGLPRGSAIAGASLTVHQGRWTGFASWRGEFGSAWSNNGGTIGVRIAF